MVDRTAMTEPDISAFDRLPEEHRLNVLTSIALSCFEGSKRGLIGFRYEGAKLEPVREWMDVAKKDPYVHQFMVWMIEQVTSEGIKKQG